MQHRSQAYSAALQAYIDAYGAWFEASIAEMQRLIPEGYKAITLYVNDTPRLTVSEIITNDGKRIDLDVYGDLYDALDDIAMQLPVHDWEDADTWFLRDPHNEDGAFILRRED